MRHDLQCHNYRVKLFAFLSKPNPPELFLPPVIIRHVRDKLEGSFVVPNPMISVRCFAQDEKTLVAEVTYGVSPMGDRVFISWIGVERVYRRRGYASSVLLAISRQHADHGVCLPITPLDEWETAGEFWGSLRNRRVPGLVVTRDICGIEERTAERLRWQQKLL